VCLVALGIGSSGARTIESRDDHTTAVASCMCPQRVQRLSCPMPAACVGSVCVSCVLPTENRRLVLVQKCNIPLTTLVTCQTSNLSCGDCRNAHNHSICSWSQLQHAGCLPYLAATVFVLWVLWGKKNRCEGTNARVRTAYDWDEVTTVVNHRTYVSGVRLCECI
jgi:hypothetical protein